MTVVGYYVLDEWGNPIPEINLLAFARSFEKCDRRLRVSYIAGMYRVSTVFLGFDHDLLGSYHDPVNHRPVLWETLVFEEKTEWHEPLPGTGLKRFEYHPTLNSYGERYHTREQALAGHQQIVDDIYEMLSEIESAGIRVTGDRQ